MKAQSIQAKTNDEIKRLLENSINDDFKPTLAFVFLSALDELKKVMTLLDTKNIAVFGATTQAEFTEQGVETKSIAILLLDVNPDYFKIVLSDNHNTSPEESAQNAGKIGRNVFADPAFIVSVSNIKTPGESIIKGLVNAVGKDVIIIGGFSGDMEMNILIRTILVTGNKIYFQVGGGIVADSTPEGEYEETLVKAKGIKACLENMLVSKLDGLRTGPDKGPSSDRRFVV